MSDETVEPIDFDAGETVTLGVTCEIDHAPVDITNYDIFFTLRAQPDPTDALDATALLKKDNDGTGGVTITAGPAGEAEVLLTSTNTKALPRDIPLHFDVRARSATSVISTVARGIIIVNTPQTNRI